MTTSGSYAFDPSFAGLLDEACERAGIDPSTITHRHIASSKMSLNLMLTEWAVRDGDALYRVASDTESVSSGVDSFTLPNGAFDIIGDDMVMDYDASGSEMSLKRISRQDYLKVPDKTATGQPTGFYVDQSNLNAPRVVLTPVPDATCALRYDYMRLVQTVGALGETLDVQRLWLEAVASGLAARLSEKYNVPRLSHLLASAERAYTLARRAGSGGSQVTISARGFGSVRTRRRS